MATFEKLIANDEFRQLPVEEQIAQVNSYWDDVSALNPDRAREAELFRQVTTGGIEAWGRANGSSGDGVYLSEAEKEAKAYDLAFASMRRGDHLSNPDMFESVMSGIRSAKQETSARMRGDIETLQSDAIAKTDIVSKLSSELEANGFLRGVLTSFGTTVGKKGISRGKSGWVAPLVTQDKEGDLGSFGKLQEYVSQQLGQTSEGDTFWQREEERALPKFLDDFQARHGLSDSEMQTAWSDLGNQNRQWKDDSEDFRIMSWGEIIPNPSSIRLLDTERVKQDVVNSTAPNIAKASFLGNLPKYQQSAAQNIAPALSALSEITPGGEDFDSALALGYSQGKSTTEIVKEYTDRNTLSELQRAYINLAIRGGTKVNQQIVGLADLIRGKGSQIGLDLAEAEALWTEGYGSASGTRGSIAKVWDAGLKEAPSVVLQVMLTRGFGAGGGATATGLGLSEQAVLTTTRFAATTAALTGAGIQSASLTYSNLMKEGYDAGLSMEEAHEKASSKAVKAGVSTAIITGLFQKIGLGGAEGAAVNSTMGTLRNEAARRGVSLATASKGFFAKLFNSPTGLAVFGEAAEEGLDEFVQTFITADDNQPIYNAWENAWEAAKVGGAIGGVTRLVLNRRGNAGANAATPEAEGARTLTEEEIANASSGVPAAGKATPHSGWSDGDTLLIVRQEGGVFTASELRNGKEVPIEGGLGRRSTRAALERDLAKRGFRQTMGIEHDGEGRVITDDNGNPQVVYIGTEQAEKQRQQVLEEERALEKRHAQWRRDNDRRAAERVKESTRTTVDADKREATLQAVDREVAAIRNRNIVDENKRTAAEQEAADQMDRIRRLQPGLQRTGAGLQVELAGEDSTIDPAKYDADEETRSGMTKDEVTKMDQEVAAAKALNDAGINTIRDLYQVLSDPRLATAPGDTATMIRSSAEIILSARQTNAPGVLVNTNAGETGPAPVTATRDNPAGPGVEPSAVPAGASQPEVAAPEPGSPEAAAAAAVEENADMFEDTPFEAAVRSAVDKTKTEISGKQFVKVDWNESGDARIGIWTPVKGQQKPRLLGFRTVKKSDFDAEPGSNQPAPAPAVATATPEVTPEVAPPTAAGDTAPELTIVKVPPANGRSKQHTWGVALDGVVVGEGKTKARAHEIIRWIKDNPEVDLNTTPLESIVPEGYVSGRKEGSGKYLGDAAKVNELSSRNNENIEAAKLGGSYGKSGIPKKFFRLDLTESEVDELSDWVGRKEEAAANYSESPSVDPNVEDARQAEIDVANELLQYHQDQLTIEEDADEDTKGSQPDTPTPTEEQKDQAAITPEDEVPPSQAKPPVEETRHEKAKKVAGEISKIFLEETGSAELMGAVFKAPLNKIKAALKRVNALLVESGMSPYNLAINSVFDPGRVKEGFDKSAESGPGDLEKTEFEKAKAEVAKIRARIREKLDAFIAEAETDEWAGEILPRVEKLIGKRMTSNSHTPANLKTMFDHGVAKGLEQDAEDLRFAQNRADTWNHSKSSKKLAAKAGDVLSAWWEIHDKASRDSIEAAEKAASESVTPDPTPPTETNESKKDKRLESIRKIAKRTEPTPESKGAAIEQAKKNVDGALPTAEEFNEWVNDAIDSGLLSQEAAIRISQITKFEDQVQAFKDRIEIAEANRAAEEESGLNPEDTPRESREEQEDIMDLIGQLEDEIFEAWTIEGDIDEDTHDRLFARISDVSTRADYEKIREELANARGGTISSELDYTKDENVESDNDQEFFYRGDADRSKTGTDAKRAAARKQLGNLIATLSDRFGIDFVWESGMDSKTRGYFSRSINRETGKTEYKIHLNNEIILDSETPLHEVGHAFTAAMRSWNPELHQSLVDEFVELAKTDNFAQGIIDEAIKFYGSDHSDSMVLDEAMVRYMGRVAKQRLNENGGLEKSDVMSDRSRTWLGRVWNSITKMLRDLFRSSPNRTRLSELSNDSTLSDIIDMMVDPDRAFDLQLGADVEQNTVQQLREMGQAIKVTTSAIKRAIVNSGRNVSMAVTEGDYGPQINLFFGDMKEAAANLKKFTDALRGSLTSDVRSKMIDELYSLRRGYVPESFWKGRSDIRQRINNLMGYSTENMSKSNLLFVLEEVLDPNLQSFLDRGDVSSPDVARVIIGISNDVGLKPSQFVAPIAARLPSSFGSAISTATMGKWAAGALDIVPGSVVQLTPEQLAHFEEALQGRSVMGNIINKVANDSGITQEKANHWLSAIFMDEAKTFHRMMPDIAQGKMMGGDVDYHKFISQGIRGVDLSLAHRGSMNLQSRSGVPSSAFGTGTVDSLYNATPATPDYASPTGFGRLAMKKDGTPHQPFSDIGKAAAFRATVATREGLNPSELRIVKAGKGGVVTYHVVVPDPLGKAEVARVGIANEVISDPGTMPNLPTIEDNRKYLENSGLNFLRLLRRTTSKMKSFLPEMDFLRSAHTQLDKVGESLNTAILNAMLQRTWARNVAAAKHSYLEATFSGVLGVNNEVGSPDYGKATNITIPAGKSPYLADILTEVMVDEAAYPLNADQLQAVREMRSMMEQMRNLMRRANIDKKWLDEQGLEAADFLADPKSAGDQSWRRYFPRMVAGYLDNQGQFQPKRYIGSGSPNTEQKGFDQKRLTDSTGKVLTMEEIMSDPELSKTVYVTNPFEAMGHFFTQAYSAMASVDLADNLAPFTKSDQRNKETLRASFVRGVPVLNEVFDNEIAAYLDVHLVESNNSDSTLSKVQRAAIALKSIALGGADIAAPLTVALPFTLTQGFGRLFAGQGFKGFAEPLEVLGRSLIRIAKRNASSEARHRAWLAQHSGLMSEVAALGGMLGGGLDYNQQADAIRKINDLKYRTAARHRFIDTVKHAGEGWLQRLSDFHREFSEMGKLLMWDVSRMKYLDANGNLRTDPDSVKAMMEEVRNIDRAMGYSNDLSVSLVSRNMKGVMNIVSTAPTMYVSLMNNLTSVGGIKKTSGVLAAGAFYYIASALAAGMREDEIFRRMRPGAKNFFTIDINIPRADGSESILKFSLSNFYKSLAVAVGKTAENTQKLWSGEPVSRRDVWAPIANLGRGKISPFASAAIGIVTGEDYFGNAINARQAISQALLPISLTDTVGAWVDRQGIPGMDIVSPEQEYMMSERDEFKKQLAQTFFAVLGGNAYGEREKQAIDRERDQISRDRHGVAFDDLDIRAAVRIAEEVQAKRGSPVKIPTSSSIDSWIRQERDRFITMFPKKYERFLRQADMQNKQYLNVPTGFKTKSGATISMSGESKRQHWQAAINEIIPKLDVLIETSEAYGAHPYGMGDEIIQVINAATRAESDAMKRAAGVK